MPSTSSRGCGCTRCGADPTRRRPVGSRAMAGSVRRQALSSHRSRQRHRSRDRAEAGRNRRRALSHRPRRRGPGEDRRRRPRAGRGSPCRAPRFRHLRLRRGRPVRRRHPRRSPGDGCGDEHRGRVGLGHRLHADARAVEVDGRRQSDGPIHVIESFVPPMVAAGTGGHLVNVSSAAGLGRIAVACRLQREQVRAAWPFRGAAVRPGTTSHRRVRRGARRGEDASGADGAHRGRRP